MRGEPLDELREELDRTNNPCLCSMIAEYLDRQGMDARGWLWLGIGDHRPVRFDSGRWGWLFEAALSPDGFPRSLLMAIPLRLMTERFDDCLSAFDAAELALRLAMDAGQLDEPTI